MSTFWTIFRKEWLAVFRDRRSLIINIVSFGIGLPLLAFLPEIVLSNSLFSQMSRSIDVAVSGLGNAPGLERFIQAEEYDDIRFVPVNDIENAIRNQKYRVGLIIPPDFDSSLANYQTAKIEVFSQQGRFMDTDYLRVSKLLDSYSNDLLARRMQEKSLPEGFMQPLDVQSHEIVTESRFKRSGASFGVVFLVTMFGVAFGMTKAVSVTTGEKEKLTMEVLLLSPANRAGIVLGKVAFILTYGFATLLGAFISSILMTIAALAGSLIALARYTDLTKVFQNVSRNISTMESPTTFPIAEMGQTTLTGLLGILLLTLCCILIFTILQVIVGLWARDESQATNLLIIISLLPGLTSMVFFLDTYNPPLWHYAIPLLGQILLIPDLLVNRLDFAALLICLMSSIVTICLLSLAAVWLLRQEVIISRT